MKKLKQLCERCNATELLELRWRVTSTAGKKYLDLIVCHQCAAIARQLDPHQIDLRVEAIGLPDSMPAPPVRP